MRSIYLLITFLMLVLSISANAQIVEVKSMESNEALEGVTFYSKDPEAFAVSNLYGKVDISDFKGSTWIHISSLGYKDLHMSYQNIIDKEMKLQLQAVSLQLEEVVISANRWDQKSTESPASISKIKAKAVQLQNPQTAADMLAISGKVFIQKSQQGGGSPMIRGFSTNRLLYSVDGVRMNTAIFRSGNIQNVINIDPYTVEQTEVLFGANSVSYGSDAIGGVMSFKSYEPQFSLDDNLLAKGAISSRFSSANEELTGHLNFNLGFKKWAFYTSVSNWNYNHLRQGSHGPSDYLKSTYVKRENGEDVIYQQEDELLQIPSAYSQLNIMQKVRFKASKDWELNYSFNISETSSYGRYDRHKRQRNGLPRYAEWNYGPQRWMMNLFSAEHHAPTALYDDMIIRLAHQNFRESRISRDLNDPIRQIREEEVDAYSVNLDLNKEIGSRNTIFYGAEVVFNDVNSNGSLRDIDSGEEKDGPSRYPDSEWLSAAVFLSNEFSLSEKLSLLGGVRYNHFALESDFTENLDFYPFSFSSTEIDQDAVTGSIGAVYRPNDKWVFRSNLGTAFRAPNVDDIGKVFDSEPGSVVVPNPNLEAEYAYNLDFGFAKIVKDLLKLEATAYYTILQNAMVRRDFTINGMDSIDYDGELSKVQAVQNAAEARVYGVQFGIEINLHKNLVFRTDLNYQEGEEETDDGVIGPARHAAPMFGVSRLSFEKKRTRLQFYAEYQGEFKASDLAISERAKIEIYALDDNGNAYAPAWYTLNFKFNQGINENISVGGGIENITDQRYRPYSSGISGAGRNFIFSFTAKF